LGTGSTLDTPETKVVPSTFQISQIPKQLLDPQSSSLTDSSQLSGLEVGETKSGQVLVLLGKGGETGDDNSEFGEENVETFS
jgi:hypothetical protein